MSEKTSREKKLIVNINIIMDESEIIFPENEVIKVNRPNNTSNISPLRLTPVIFLPTIQRHFHPSIQFAEAFPHYIIPFHPSSRYHNCIMALGFA